MSYPCKQSGVVACNEMDVQGTCSLFTFNLMSSRLSMSYNQIQLIQQILDPGRVLNLHSGGEDTFLLQIFAVV